MSAILCSSIRSSFEQLLFFGSKALGVIESTQEGLATATGSKKAPSPTHQNWKRPFAVALACVASVSHRVIARRLEREQKTKRWKGEGEGKSGNACPQTPPFWKTPLEFHGSWQLVKIEDKTNRSPLDYLICKINLFSNRRRSMRLQKL